MTVTGDFTLELVVGQVRELLENGRRADAPRLVGPAERTGQPRSEPLLAALERVAFRTAVEPAGAALQGSLEVMDLAEVAQAIALGGKTGSLVVSLAAGQGVIAFDAGRIVHADFLGRSGEPAFAAIVAASQRETDARFPQWVKALSQLRTYIVHNRHVIPNDGARYRKGEAIATGFVESTVNEVVSKRFCKKQQMQWSKEGAHLLLQTRVRTLNGELGAIFKRWYPDMDLEVEEIPIAA